MSRRSWLVLAEAVAIVATAVFYWVPFYFVFVNASKDEAESAVLNLSLPTRFQLLKNIKEVLTEQDYLLIRAFYNSTVLTVLSVSILILVSAMAGYVMHRRPGRLINRVQSLVMVGLMIPPAVVPTIWVLQAIGMFKTLPGIVLIEVALSFPFAVLLYRGFMGSIPREIDEAAMLDGCGPIRLFFQIIFPLLRPVNATVAILSTLSIYNDFVNPLYFYPGRENATVQLTLYNFTSMYNTSWNLLFANILLISIPPLLLFLAFNKKIVAGMTAGSIKG